MLNLNAEKITAKLSDKNKYIKLNIFDSIDSTNDFFKTNKQTSDLIEICLAESQTQGRGQFDRRWHSPWGKNIYLSMKYIFTQNSKLFAGLSLVVGLSVARVIDSQIGWILERKKEVLIKWPNDIYIVSQDAKKKLGGVLIETQSCDVNEMGQKAKMIIIGIGLNINMDESEDKTSQNLPEEWTSILKEAGEVQDRNHWVALILEALIQDLEKFETFGFSAFESAWREKDYLFGRSVLVKLPDRTERSGQAVGVDSSGRLLLKLEDGLEENISAFASGEIYIKNIN